MIKKLLNDIIECWKPLGWWNGVILLLVLIEAYLCIRYIKNIDELLKKTITNIVTKKEDYKKQRNSHPISPVKRDYYMCSQNNTNANTNKNKGNLFKRFAHLSFRTISAYCLKRKRIY